MIHECLDGVYPYVLVIVKDGVAEVKQGSVYGEDFVLFTIDCDNVIFFVRVFSNSFLKCDRAECFGMQSGFDFICVLVVHDNLAPFVLFAFGGCPGYAGARYLGGFMRIKTFGMKLPVWVCLLAAVDVGLFLYFGSLAVSRMIDFLFDGSGSLRHDIFMSCVGASVFVFSMFVLICINDFLFYAYAYFSKSMDCGRISMLAAKHADTVRKGCPGWVVALGVSIALFFVGAFEICGMVQAFMGWIQGANEFELAFAAASSVLVFGVFLIIIAGMLFMAAFPVPCYFLSRHMLRFIWACVRLMSDASADVSTDAGA